MDEPDIFHVLRSLGNSCWRYGHVDVSIVPAAICGGPLAWKCEIKPVLRLLYVEYRREYIFANQKKSKQNL